MKPGPYQDPASQQWWVKLRGKAKPIGPFESEREANEALFEAVGMKGRARADAARASGKRLVYGKAR